MKLKADIKEKIHLCLWAVIILAVVPVLFGAYKNPKENTPSSSESEEISAEDAFAEDSSYHISVPDNATWVIPADLSGNKLTNKTKYNVTEKELDFSSDKDKDIAVLIIHTYGTQSYSVEGYTTAASTLKSEDEDLNVICVGKALEKALGEKGIKVIHDKTMYDKISYSNAYNLSTEAVKNHIKNNPNIKYVIDIQRDSVFSQKGNCIKAVTNTPKGKAAQIGFISGCDENGADFPHWKENLSLSYALSEKLYQFNPKLSRGVTLLPSGYGQYSSKGFVTVEIGTAGNTPKEAKNAAEFLAEALYEVIY